MSRFPQPSSDIALGQLSRGRVRTAAEAAFGRPESLVGEQRESLADRLFGQEDSFAKQAFTVVTNPLVAIGLALHLRFPIPTAQNILNFSEQVAGANKFFIPFVEKTQSFWDKFKGTDVAETVFDLVGQSAQFEARHATSFSQAIRKWEEASGRSFNNLPDQFRIFARLDGLDDVGNPMWKNFGGEVVAPQLFRPGALNRADTDLVADFRKTLSEEFGEVVKRGREAGVRDSTLVAGLNQHGMAASRFEDIEELDRFIAHVQTRGGNDLIQRMAQEASRAIDDPAAARAATLNAPVMAKSLKVRRNQMIPDLEELREADEAGLLMPGALDHLRAVKQANPNIREYTMKTSKALSVYTHSMGKTFAFETLGLGKKLADQTQALKGTGKFRGGDLMAHSLETNFIPLLKGRKSIQEYRRGLEFGAVELASLDWLDGIAQRGGGVGKLAGKMRDLLKTRGIDLDQTVASHFFHSTLGLNPASPVLNMFQNLSTTGNIVGFDVLAEAGAKVSSRFSPFLTTTTFDKAKLLTTMNKHFPEFVKSGVDINPFVAEMANLNREITRIAGQPGVARRAFEKGKDVSMFMFGRSELWNRLVAFESGMIKAARDGLDTFQGQTGMAARRAFSRQLTEITQFAGDPVLSSPEFLLGMPKVLRQFMTFPTRFANFVGGTATAVGSGADAAQINLPFIKGRNFGTLGRMMMFSGLLGEGSRQFLGVDLNKFTPSGAVPTPLGFGPVPGAPVLPPAVGVGLTLAENIHSGEFDDSKQLLGLLAPGGIEALRLGQAGVPGLQKVARFAGRDTADWNQRNPDGTVNVFDPNGNFKFALTPTQIWMRAAGLPVGNVQLEQEFRRQVVAQRDTIRDVKRQWMGKTLSNDHAGAQKISKQFEQSFGFPLAVRPQDIKAAKHRRNLSRLQREIERAPRELKGQFKQALRLLDARTTAGLIGANADPTFFDGVPPADPVRTSFGVAGGTRPDRPRAFGQGLGSGFGQQRAPQSQSTDVGTMFGTGVGQ